jgi:hypothetical protein
MGQGDTVIIKVFIVRCSYCHAALCDPHSMNYMPRYFYRSSDIEEAMAEQSWSIEKGLQVCFNCVQKNSYNSSNSGEQ